MLRGMPCLPSRPRARVRANVRLHHAPGRSPTVSSLREKHQPAGRRRGRGTPTAGLRRCSSLRRRPLWSSLLVPWTLPCWLTCPQTTPCSPSNNGRRWPWRRPPLPVRPPIAPPPLLLPPLLLPPRPPKHRSTRLQPQGRPASGWSERARRPSFRQSRVPRPLRPPPAKPKTAPLLQPAWRALTRMLPQPNRMPPRRLPGLSRRPLQSRRAAAGWPLAWPTCRCRRCGPS
mmetsp:Transcript_34839/g.98779  ORF Transcript_34839/g.98779 Transcript_34839/m.98779 type:complete len:230 (-) Transcript_34839:540-1229(-)